MDNRTRLVMLIMSILFCSLLMIISSYSRSSVVLYVINPLIFTYIFYLLIFIRVILISYINCFNKIKKTENSSRALNRIENDNPEIARIKLFAKNIDLAEIFEILLKKYIKE
jgi:hypothetical protein